MPGVFLVFAEPRGLGRLTENLLQTKQHFGIDTQMSLNRADHCPAANNARNPIPAVPQRNITIVTNRQLMPRYFFYGDAVDVPLKFQCFRVRFRVRVRAKDGDATFE